MRITNIYFYSEKSITMCGVSLESFVSLRIVIVDVLLHGSFVSLMIVIMDVLLHGFIYHFKYWC
jgi:hypothetical protein